MSIYLFIKCMLLVLFIVVEDAHAGPFKGGSKQMVWRAYLVCPLNSSCSFALGQNKSMSDRDLGSCCVVPAGLELAVFPPPPQACWDCSPVPEAHQLLRCKFPPAP
jgi:hypothetical protein